MIDVAFLGTHVRPAATAVVIDVLRAYGAEVVVTPTSVAPDSPESYYSVSDRLARRREQLEGWTSFRPAPVRCRRHRDRPLVADGPAV